MNYEVRGGKMRGSRMALDLVRIKCSNIVKIPLLVLG